MALKKNLKKGQGRQPECERDFLTNQKLTLMNTTLEVLNDLVRINNDRIEGYRRAINEAKDLDIDLKAVFNNCINDSETFRNELAAKVKEHGGTPPENTTISGKVYRLWMDLKATFTGSDRKAILASCEFGEDAAQKAYAAALDNDDVQADAIQLIAEQKQVLKKAHDLIKKYRDAHEPVK